MIPRPLPEFKPLTTHRCVIGFRRRIYEFHDHPLGEDLLLGLGAGVGFVYWHMKGALPLYRGRDNTGGQVKRGWRKLPEGAPVCALSPSTPAAPGKQKGRCWRC